MNKSEARKIHTNLIQQRKLFLEKAEKSFFGEVLVNQSDADKLKAMDRQISLYGQAWNDRISLKSSLAIGLI